MNMAAFVSLEDISAALPPYTEEIISVEMDPPLREAYQKLEDDISEALRNHHGNSSVISTAMNALLLYPDKPHGLGPLYGYTTNEDGERERFLISEPTDLDENVVYAKERRLIEECKKEIAAGRLLQVFAVYTQKRDVTRRMQNLLLKEGIRAEVLTADVPPEQREAWYEKKLAQGMQVCICHPKLVQVGLDLLFAKSILFYETGYSTYVLRQASRRSWRIGQKDAIRVGFLVYAGTAQETCLRLMGKKLLVSLAMEGKLDGGGLQAMDEDDDVLTAMARELVTHQGVGEEAAAVWRALQQSRDEHAPSAMAIEASIVEPILGGRRTPMSGERGRTEPVGSRGSLLRAIDAVLIAAPAQWRYRPGTLAERRRHLRILCHSATIQGKLTDARAQIPDPFRLVRSMDDASEKTEALGDVVPIGKDRLAGGLHVFLHPLVQAFWLCENVGCVPRLGYLNDHGTRKVEDELIAKQVHCPGTLGELLVVKGIVTRLPRELGHIEIARQSSIPAEPPEFVTLHRDAFDLLTQEIDLVEVPTDPGVLSPRDEHQRLQIPGKFHFRSAGERGLPFDEMPLTFPLLVLPGVHKIGSDFDVGVQKAPPLVPGLIPAQGEKLLVEENFDLATAVAQDGVIAKKVELP